MSTLAQSLSRGIGKVTESALAPYQSAVIRIGFSATWLLFLLREFPHRQELYGPDAPWNWDLARQLTGDNGAFTVLLWFRGRFWFEAVYVLAVLASACCCWAGARARCRCCSCSACSRCRTAASSSGTAATTSCT